MEQYENEIIETVQYRKFLRPRYKVEKLVDECWWYEGTWDDPKHLARCMFNLGQIGKNIDEIRITEV